MKTLAVMNDLEAALEAVAAGKFHPVIDSVYSPDQAEEFLRRSFGAEPRFGKSLWICVAACTSK